MKNLVHFYTFCLMLHLFAAPSYGFTYKKVNEEIVCQFLKWTDNWFDVGNTWHFVWKNYAKNISPMSEVTQLWTEECIKANKEIANLPPVEELVEKVSGVELRSHVLMISQTFFCGLTNLEILTLEIGLVDVAEVGLNLTGDCETSKCGQKLKKLVLYNNKFSILKNRAFRCLGNLETLILDYCEIESIEEKAFANLKNLTMLSMKRNKLTFLSPHLFSGNLGLKSLTLSYNNLTHHSLNSLQILTELKYLKLRNNNIENLNYLLKCNFTELKTADFKYNLLTNYNNEIQFNSHGNKLLLEGNRLTNFYLENSVEMFLIDLRNNQLTNIPKFNHFQASQKLKMSSNKITSISSFQFINFAKLNRVILKSNKISLISSNAFTFDTEIEVLDLSGNQIEMLNQTFTQSKIKKLILDFNYLKLLSFSDFSNVSETISIKNNHIISIESIRPNEFRWKESLVELDLSYNQIDTFKIQFPIFLKRINLRGNKIKLFLYEDFQWLCSSELGLNLEELSLADNQIETITATDFYSKYYDKPLDVSTKVHLEGNLLKCSCENVWILRYKKSLLKFMSDLNFIECISMLHFETHQKTQNLLSLRHEDLFCESNFTNSNRCKVKRSDYDQFECKFTCPTPCICYTSSYFTIAHIYCSKKNLTQFPTDFEQTQIRNSTNLMLYLDGNNFNSINCNHFYNFSYLKQLHLNQSNIKVLEKSAFDLLPMLEILHLDNNQISNLPANIFINLHNLQELHLSNNLISHLESKLFLPLISLNFLSLDNNLLFNFTVWELEPLKTLTLHSNPWSCDCQFALQFQQFLQNHTAVIPNIKNVFCIENGKNLISMLSFNSTHCFPPSVTKSLIHILISVGVVFLSITLIVVLVFIYRREVQVLIYSHYKIRLFNNQNDVGKKFYDAFVIYSDLDVQFLVNNFIPKLEEIENPYKLCVHDRDFLPGAFIQDNITQAVQESYRSIVLLSQNLLNSNWCLYEFKVAHAQMVNDGDHRVILIVIGEIPADIDEEMKLYLKTKTYLKWNEKLFWEKLYFVMSDKRVANSRSQLLESHFVGGHLQLQST